MNIPKMTDEQVDAVYKAWSDFQGSATELDLINMAAAARDAQWQAALAEQEPVARVHRNEAGQITMQTHDGAPFDMSQFVNALLYTHPAPTNPAAQEPVGKLIRGEGGAFRFGFPDSLLPLYDLPPGEHDLYAAQERAEPVAPATERTGNPEVDRVLDRLDSSDPDFDDCAAAAALIYKLEIANRGPEGFATWKDAAFHERMLRLSATPPAPAQPRPLTQAEHEVMRKAQLSSGVLVHSGKTAQPSPEQEQAEAPSEISKRLAQTMTVLEFLPESPGYNGSVLMMDDVERNKVLEDLRAVEQYLAKGKP